MKKLILCFAALTLFLFTLKSQELAYVAISVETNTETLTSVDWDKEIYDFGEIIQNIPAVAEFEFTNTGDKPLIISKVLGSCGCTSTDYPKDPILPGEKSKIKATYNAKSVGSFKKNVTVFSNSTEGEKRLKLSGIVIKL